MKSSAAITLCVLMLCWITADTAWGHVFFKGSEPRVGARVVKPPIRVCIWFDDEVEATPISLRVEDTAGRSMDKGDAHVDPSDATRLEVSLPPLASGAYHVFWSVVSRDGHHAKGDFTFTVR